MIDEIQHSKFVNEKVTLFFGEANLFIYFLIPLIVFKSQIILYLFLGAYIFSIYLRFTGGDIHSFIRKSRFVLTKGFRDKKYRKRY